MSIPALVYEYLHESVLKHIGDGVSLGVVILTIVGWLPSIAAALTIVWTIIRIYETKTVQHWLNRRE